MKYLIRPIAVFMAAIVSPDLTASSVIDLNVQGTLIPAPCTVVIAGGNRYNFGTILADDLEATQQTHYFQSKVISIVCPAPTGLWVAFPFENGAQLRPHGNSGVNTGYLKWWTPSHNTTPIEACNFNLEENEKTRIDEGDGVLKDNSHYMRIYQGGHVVQDCPTGSVYDGDIGRHDGSEDGYYIAHPRAKMLQIPRHLRMTLNPRDLLDTSGVIKL